MEQYTVPKQHQEKLRDLLRDFRGARALLNQAQDRFIMADAEIWQFIQDVLPAELNLPTRKMWLDHNTLTVKFTPAADLPEGSASP